MNTTKTKVVLIDDEPMARILLTKMIEDHCPDLEVVASESSLPDGIKSIRKWNPALVFIDIQMPGYSGLEILDFFEGEVPKFHIIFTTAFDRFAIEAFKVSAIGYLLKPIQVEDLVDVVERYHKLMESQNISVIKGNTSTQQVAKVAIPTLHSTMFIPVDEILYLKASGSYTELTLANNKKIMVSKGLIKFESSLQAQKEFFRCHKSYIVNINFVIEHIRADGGSLKMQNDELIPLSSEKLDEFIKLMQWL